MELVVKTALNLGSTGPCITLHTIFKKTPFNACFCASPCKSEHNAELNTPFP